MALRQQVIKNILSRIMKGSLCQDDGFKQLSALSVFIASIYQFTINEAHAYNSLKCAETSMVPLNSLYINSHWLRNMRNQMLPSPHILCIQIPYRWEVWKRCEFHKDLNMIISVRLFGNNVLKQLT